MAVLFTGLAGAASAGEPEIYTSWKNNLAVGGYDVISFYSGAPVKGSDNYTQTYKDVEWHFSTRANLDLFRTNPDAFVPQYGGYCAWAVAHGKLAKGSPKYWHVRDGKLYLNFNKSVQTRWDRDRDVFIQNGDKNWPKILLD